MKKIFLVIMLLLFFVASPLINVATAGNIKEDLAGHTYGVVIEKEIFDIKFYQGPFGPGPAGDAILMQNGVVVSEYKFFTIDDMIYVEGLGNFFYGNFQIVYVPGTTALILRCKDCLTQ